MTESNSSAALVAVLRRELDDLSPGARLPSTRALVERHHVSPVTVSRALAALATEGLVVTRPGAGTFVAEPAPAAAPIDFTWQTVALGERVISAEGISPLIPPPSETAITLNVGYLHGSLMPVRQLAAAASRAARLPGAWETAPLGGLSGLRRWFATAVGAGVDARDVTVVPGGQAALSAALRALVAPGEVLLVDSPGYPGALGLARAAGMRLVPVPGDEHGILPGPLAETFERTRAKAVLLQPTWTNPTGAVLSPERRGPVLEAAAGAGAFIVEDDYARWLGHTAEGARARARAPRPLLADDGDGRVVHLTSLTKVTSPSLRIGAVTARGPVTERIRALRVVDDLFVGRPVQETALELVTTPAWDRHLDTLGRTLDRRARTFARAVADELPATTLGPRPTGGVHLWVRLPDHVDDTEAARVARAGGVTVMPGRPFFAAEPPAPHLRLTFSAAADEAALVEGVRRLAAAVPELRG